MKVASIVMDAIGAAIGSAIGILVTVIALSGCAGHSVKADVAALKLALAAADTAAVAYVELPTCAPSAPPLCSKPDVIARIDQASRTTYEAIGAADALVDSYDPSSSMAINGFRAAAAALAGYQAIIATLPGRR